MLVRASLQNGRPDQDEKNFLWVLVDPRVIMGILFLKIKSESPKEEKKKN